MNNIKSPCYGCDERYVGCHGKCNSYIQYQVEVKNLNNHRFVQNDSNCDLWGTKLKLKKYKNRY